MDFEILSRQNIWWIDKRLVDRDIDIKKWRKGKRRWIPLLLDKISLKPFSLNFIFGPRQVGKTTLLKLLVKRLLESGVDPKKIFYFRCDMLSDYKELDEIINIYLEFRSSHDIEGSYILLDEITYPKEWYRTIKFHIDNGDFQNDVLILTGSLSMHLKREVELFPGRRGSGETYIMLPLSFREFIMIFNPALYKKLPTLKNLSRKEILNKIYKTLPYSHEISRLFNTYLEIGGFPLSIKNEEISEDVLDSYWAWIRTDLAKIGRNEDIFKRVAKAILEKASSPLSLNSIAREFEIGTHKTVFEYISVMENMFITKVLYWIDPNKLVTNFKKNRKVHLTDPLYFKLFSEICLTKMPKEDIIVESIIAAVLGRRLSVFHWRDGREIDIVASDGNIVVGLEVKWREKIGQDYSRIKIGRIKEIYCLTKNKFDPEANILPAANLLALI